MIFVWKSKFKTTWGAQGSTFGVERWHCLLLNTKPKHMWCWWKSDTWVKPKSILHTFLTETVLQSHIYYSEKCESSAVRGWRRWGRCSRSWAPSRGATAPRRSRTAAPPPSPPSSARGTSARQRSVQPRHIDLLKPGRAILDLIALFHNIRGITQRMLSFSHVLLCIFSHVQNGRVLYRL